MGETWDCCCRGIWDPEAPRRNAKNAMREARKRCAVSPGTTKKVECMKWRNRCAMCSGTEMYTWNKRDLHYGLLNHVFILQVRKDVWDLVNANGRRYMHNAFRDGWVMCPRIRLGQPIYTIMPYRFKQKPSQMLSDAFILPLHLLKEKKKEKKEVL